MADSDFTDPTHVPFEALNNVIIPLLFRVGIQFFFMYLCFNNGAWNFKYIIRFPLAVSLSAKTVLILFACDSERN